MHSVRAYQFFVKQILKNVTSIRQINEEILKDLLSIPVKFALNKFTVTQEEYNGWASAMIKYLDYVEYDPETQLLVINGHTYNQQNGQNNRDNSTNQQQ